MANEKQIIRKRDIVAKTVQITVKVIAGIFLAYAVLFALAGTVAIAVAYHYVSAPFFEVKRLKTENPRETAFMKAVRKQLSQSGSRDTIRQIFVPLDSMAPSLKQAVLAAEDDGFYFHPGIDIEAILSATQYNRQAGANRRGASTITQQLAKNLFLSNERSFKRKYLELAYTILMEMYLGKDRILELYLNYAQWGKNIFGCEAASQLYFHKPAKKLSLDESIRMAAVLAAPCRISPLNETSVLIGRRSQVIANNLFGHRIIDTATLSVYSPQVAESLRTVDSLQAATSADSTIPLPMEPAKSRRLNRKKT